MAYSQPHAPRNAHERRLDNLARAYGSSWLWAQDRLDRDRHIERIKQNERRAQAITMNDFGKIFRDGPQRAAALYREYRYEVQRAQNDPYLTDTGRLHRAAELQDIYAERHKLLAEEIRLAGTLEEKRLKHERDATRPAPDNATHERLTRRFSYLLDRGVNLSALVEENASNPDALRVLSDEAATFARGAMPDDPQAGQGYAAKIDQAGRDAYGDNYKAADDRLRHHQRATQFVENALNGSGRGIAHDADVFALIDHDGQVIDVGA